MKLKDLLKLCTQNINDYGYNHQWIKILDINHSLLFEGRILDLEEFDSYFDCDVISIGTNLYTSLTIVVEGE